MRKFGWKKDPEDKRDWRFRHVLKEIAVAELPERVDLRDGMSPVENQENIGSCVANAVVGSLEYLELVKTQKRFMCFNQYRDLSRLFVYYNARRNDSCVESDDGTTIRSAIKMLAEYGVCDERVWPYNTDKWAQRPPDKAYDQAEKREIRDYSRAGNIDEVRQALALGFPVPFGAMIYDSFSGIGNDGKVDMPKVGEQMLGGHAMLIVGYDLKEECFIVRNSWGTDWGKEGYCYFPAEYLAKADLADDFWVIRK
jgi:C1A family cysteine protease